MSLNFIKPERFPIAGYPEYGEKWVQERIAEGPSILGLGEIVLALLFQDAESSAESVNCLGQFPQGIAKQRLHFLGGPLEPFAG